MTFDGYIGQCVHLPCVCVVADGTGIAAGIGAVADVCVLQNGDSLSCKMEVKPAKSNNRILVVYSYNILSAHNYNYK